MFHILALKGPKNTFMITLSAISRVCFHGRQSGLVKGMGECNAKSNCLGSGGLRLDSGIGHE
jgi:hypothetical protein